MPEIGGLPKRLSQAVGAYVALRGKRHTVSLREIVNETSHMMPELRLTEKELADLIAAKLVVLGCNINFDMSEAAPQAPRDQNPPQRARPRTPIDYKASPSAR